MMPYIYWCEACNRYYEENEPHRTCGNCGEEWEFEGKGELRCIVEKHGETKRGVFWCQIRVGDLRIVGRSLKADRFEDVKRHFKLVFESQDHARRFMTLDASVVSAVQREVKRAWIKVKQPLIEYVKNSQIFLEADPPSC
jgi:hypothetical protein